MTHETTPVWPCLQRRRAAAVERRPALLRRLPRASMSAVAGQGPRPTPGPDRRGCGLCHTQRAPRPPGLSSPGPGGCAGSVAPSQAPAGSPRCPAARTAAGRVTRKPPDGWQAPPARDSRRRRGGLLRTRPHPLPGQARAQPPSAQPPGRPLAARHTGEHQPRPPVQAKHKRRGRLRPVAAPHPDWVLGCLEEPWWSRLAPPSRPPWTAGAPLPLLEHVGPRGAPAPQALCCDGLLRPDGHQIRLRFGAGRPGSHVTTALLRWLGQRRAAERKRGVGLIWANASWPMSQEGRRWSRAQNQPGTRHGGVRLLPCRWPVKSPGLHPLEPHGVHGKRAIVAPHRLLTAAEVIDSVHDDFETDQVAPLHQHVA
jgi:hypothetical protein